MLSNKILLLLLISWFYLNHSFAQHEIIELDGMDFTENVSAISNLKTRVFEIKAVPIENADPFLAISVVWHTEETLRENQKFWLAMGEQSSQWSAFHPLFVDPHSDSNTGRFVSNLVFASKNTTQFRLYLQAPIDEMPNISSIEIHFFNPQKTESLESDFSLNNREACVCPQPDFLDRMDWCPAGNCPPDATPVFTEPTHIVIHHTATSNTSADWAATVRSVWDFHVNTNGWDDVGYNWLIDPEGNLYEGRGDNTIGAHFCSTNTGTVGIAMLGNFETGAATEAAKTTLKNLLAWKSCDIERDPNGEEFHNASNQTLNNILGHRDGCSTACPGDNFYPLIPGIRNDVITIQETECEAKLSTPTTLTREVINANFIKLDWVDNSTSEENYVLERAIGNGGFSLLAALPANTITYNDETTEVSTTYKYRVKAVADDIVDSDYSNEVSAFSGTNAVKNQFLNQQTVQIFPNPNNGNFHLNIENELKGQVEIQILDLTGKELTPNLFYNKTADQFSENLNFDNLSTGVYFIKIIQNGHLAWFYLNIL